MVAPFFTEDSFAVIDRRWVCDGYRKAGRQNSATVMDRRYIEGRSATPAQEPAPATFRA